MKRLLLFVACCCAWLVSPVAGQAPAGASDLTFTLPSGRVITFQSVDQKARYLQAVSKAQTAASQSALAAYQQTNQEIEQSAVLYEQAKVAAAQRKHCLVESASVYPGGFLASVCPMELHSYSNSVIEDAMGGNRTYYYERGDSSSNFRAFVVWDTVKSPLKEGAFEVDLYPCGQWLSGGFQYPKFSTDPSVVFDRSRVDQNTSSTEKPAVVSGLSKQQLADLVAASKARALKKHPDLAVDGSTINSRFKGVYQVLVSDNDRCLQEPDWPEKLADKCAAGVPQGGQ